MPAEQALIGQRRGEVLRGIEHHLDHTFDVAVGGLHPTGVKAKAAGNGRAHLVRIELLTLNLAGLQHVQRQGLQLGLFLQGKAQPLHPAPRSRPC